MYKGLTPAQRWKQKTSAKNSDAIAPGASAYDKALHTLNLLKKTLSGIKATKTKEQFKKTEALPTLSPYIEGVLESDQASQNDVLVYAMVWAFDADDLELSLDIAKRVIDADMSMPEEFKRDAVDWLASAYADRTIELFDARKDRKLSSEPFEVFSIIEGKDITDQPLAKLHKAMGNVIHFIDPEAALRHYKDAHELWDRVGTKKLYESLEKKLTEKTEKTEKQTEKKDKKQSK